MNAGEKFGADMAGVTPFRRRVYEALLGVPRGMVITYGSLGRRIGCASARAIGQALKANPFAPHVPCHRVIASDGTLHGFNGKKHGEELVRKRVLLEAEGVVFSPDGHIVDKKRMLTR